MGKEKNYRKKSRPEDEEDEDAYRDKNRRHKSSPPSKRARSKLMVFGPDDDGAALSEPEYVFEEDVQEIKKKKKLKGMDRLDAAAAKLKKDLPQVQLSDEDLGGDDKSSKKKKKKNKETEVEERREREKERPREKDKKDRDRDRERERDRDRDRERERDRDRDRDRERGDRGRDKPKSRAERDRERDQKTARGSGRSRSRSRSRGRDGRRREDKKKDKKDKGGGGGGGLDDILKKLAGKISAKVEKKPELEAKEKEKKEKEMKDQEDAKKAKMEKLKKWKEELAAKGALPKKESGGKWETAEDEDAAAWAPPPPAAAAAAGGALRMGGPVASLAAAAAPKRLGQGAAAAAGGLGFDAGAEADDEDDPGAKLRGDSDDEGPAGRGGAAESKGGEEEEEDPLDAFMSAVLGSEEVRDVAQESFNKGMAEPATAPLTAPEKPYGFPLVEGKGNGATGPGPGGGEAPGETGEPPPPVLDTPALRGISAAATPADLKGVFDGVTPGGDPEDDKQHKRLGSLDAYGSNVVTLEDIMKSGNKEQESWESDAEMTPNIEDEKAQEERYERERKEFMEAFKKREKEEERKARLAQSLGRLENNDGDMVEEHERAKEARNALEVLQEMQKSKELKEVNHDEIDYLPIRKNLFILPKKLAKLKAEEVKKIRDGLQIKIRGKGCPPPVATWEECGFSERVLKVIQKLGLKEPFPIQRQAFPAIMGGRDVIGVAKTGSGKTLAFVLPLLRHILDQPPLGEGEGPIGLIMAPARELAFQIYDQAKKFTKMLGLRCTAVYGGAGIADQIGDLKRGADIVVCTPGRMIDILTMQAGKLVSFQRVSFVVMDEADRMFDMGFEPQIKMILRNVRPDRQVALFSATFPRQVEQLARKVLRFPLEIIVGGRSVASDNITQYAEVREEDDKYMRLLQLLGVWYERGSVLVFVDSQAKCDLLFKDLQGSGYPVMALHGGMDQQDRDYCIDDFKKGVCTILVATSVAGRGLDVPGCRCVVNYSCPNHLEDYVHRVGRTGRAGRKGTAYTFLCPKDEDQYAPLLVKALSQGGQDVPEELQKVAEDFKAKVERGEARWASSGFSSTKGFTFDADELTERQRMEKMEKEFFLKDSGVLVEDQPLADSDDEEPEAIKRAREEEERRKKAAEASRAAPPAAAAAATAAAPPVARLSQADIVAQGVAQLAQGAAAAAAGKGTGSLAGLVPGGGAGGVPAGGTGVGSLAGVAPAAAAAAPAAAGAGSLLGAGPAGQPPPGSLLGASPAPVPAQTPQQLAQNALLAALGKAPVAVAAAVAPPPPAVAAAAPDPQAALAELPPDASPLEKAKRLAALLGGKPPGAAAAPAPMNPHLAAALGHAPPPGAAGAGGLPGTGAPGAANNPHLAAAFGGAVAGSVVDPAKALDKAKSIIAGLGLPAAKGWDGKPREEIFSFEIEINEYPQQARYRVQHKETINRVEEDCSVSVITRGIYCPPGRRPDADHGKLRLFVEGPSKIHLDSARRELQRVLNEETMRAGISQSYGKYSVL